MNGDQFQEKTNSAAMKENSVSQAMQLPVADRVKTQVTISLTEKKEQVETFVEEYGYHPC
jgi:hypothetical protein